MLPQQNERLGIVSVIQMEGLFFFTLGKLEKKKKKFGLLSNFSVLTDDLQFLFLGKRCQNKPNKN